MRLLSTLLNAYMWLIIIRVILSWIRPWPRSRVEVVLYQLTEPTLGAVRRVVPPMGGLDLSPVVVIVLISLLQQLLLR